MEWWPTACTLTFNFSESHGVRCGSVYQGTSTIRYRKKTAVPPPTTKDGAAFFAIRKHVQSLGGLHCYGYTRVNASFAKKAKPLEILQYKVSRVGDAKGPLKLTSVKEVDTLDELLEGEKTASKKESNSAAGKKAGRGKKTQQQDTTEEACGDVIGSKIVLFQESDALPLDSQVELSMTFRGTVQDWDEGGIYCPNHTQNVILTHFEVFLSRLAFPSPDHPRYRVRWQMKQLQLPSSFSTVLHNCGETSSKVQGDSVQYSFPSFGPLPAYLVCFAAITETLLVHHDTFTHQEFPMSLSPPVEASLRVVALPGRGVEPQTLERVAELVKKSVPLLESFFRCPFPALLTDCFTVALLPTMPYISGMEHHGCIFLNETIYSTHSKSPPSGAERDQLVIHEVTHHWAGNSLGLCFSVKEGICLLLEQVFESIIQGRPVKKVKSAHNTGATFDAVESGKEFTGHTYQNALLALENVLNEIGYANFEERIQKLFDAHLISWMQSVEAWVVSRSCSPLVPA
ncbi:aminopeptidase [Angomonas deanei]|nr:aminopeptidase [Angomonas deanei]|eukprot:EPY27016.1 aminopeptidase [Angomonas deanei]